MCVCVCVCVRGGRGCDWRVRVAGQTNTGSADNTTVRHKIAAVRDVHTNTHTYISASHSTHTHIQQTQQLHHMTGTPKTGVWRNVSGPVAAFQAVFSRRGRGPCAALYTVAAAAVWGRHGAAEAQGSGDTGPDRRKRDNTALVTHRNGQPGGRQRLRLPLRRV